MKKKEIKFLFDHQNELHDKIIFDEIKNQINIKSKKQKNVFHLKYVFAGLVVLLAMFTLTGLGIHSIKVEANEYQAAVDFFESNQLSLEGLTRTEVKEIYRDITTKTFKHEKTGEVITNSIKDKIPGYEINLENTSADYLLSVWEYWDQIIQQEVENEKGVYYDYRSYDDTSDYIKTVFSKYENNVQKWNIELYYYIDGFKEYNNYLIVYGHQLSYYSTENLEKAYVTKINNAGEIIWQHEFLDSSKFYNIFVNTDNTLTVFLNKTYKSSYLKMYHIGNNGEVSLKNEKYFDGGYIKNIAKLNNDYLAYITYTDYDSQFIKINNEGNIDNEFTYEDEKYRYFFTDMIEYNGKLYLSAYSVPYFDGHVYERRETWEITNIMKTMYYNNEKITDEFVLSLFNEKYKAVLFVCDNESGKLTDFYTANSAIGAELHIEDNNLIWNVEYFKTMMFSPLTSSFTYGGVTEVHDYIYDNNGILLGTINTEELRIFRRL